MKTPYTSDLAVLNSMTLVKNIFIKYNTAFVEQLFSIESNICSKKKIAYEL